MPCEWAWSTSDGRLDEKASNSRLKDRSFITEHMPFPSQTLLTGSARHSVKRGVLLILGFLIISSGLIIGLGLDKFDEILLVELGLTTGLVFLLFLFGLPQAGYAFLVLGCLLVKNEIGTETQSAINPAIVFSTLIVLVWLMLRLFYRHHQRPLSSCTIVPVLSFLAVTCIAFLIGQYPWFSVPAAPMHAQIGQLLIFLFSCLLFLAAADQLQDIRWLKIITSLYIFFGMFHMLPRIGPISTLWIWKYLPQSITGESMFWTWLIALSSGQAIVNRELHPAVRIVLGLASVGVLGVALSEVGWVSGWAPPLFSVFVILFLRFPVPVLVVSPFLAITAFVGRFLYWDVLTAGDNLYSYNTRLEALKSLLPIIKANPLFGLGLANYYHYTLLNPIIGWYVKFNSHSNYIDLIAQTGLVGLASFGWVAWSIGRTAWGLRFAHLSGFEQGYVASVLGGLLATLGAAFLGDWIIPFVYNTGFAGFRASVLAWVFMGGLIALQQRTVQNS